MSSYNRKIEQSSVVQNIPGTSMQQMWHVMNFHEQRFVKLAELLKSSEEKRDLEIKELTERIKSLEASEK
jgi:hypothetical protein